jgi:hypothetical protein
MGKRGFSRKKRKTFEREFMRVQKLVQAFMGVLLASACSASNTCKIGDAASCPEPYTVCYGGEDAKRGSKGICVEGELLGEGPPWKLVAAVKGWKLFAEPVGEVAPLLWDERDVEAAAGLENAQAGWAGPKAAFIEAELVGLKAGEALKAWAGDGEGEENAKCTFEGAAEDGRGQRWKCTFKEGWSLAEPEEEKVVVKLKPGAEARERERTYRVDAHAPLVSLTVSAVEKCEDDSHCPGRRCWPISGSTHGACVNSNEELAVRVCVHAQDMQSGLEVFEPIPPPNASLTPISHPLEIKWEYEKEACWTGKVSAAYEFSIGEISHEITVSGIYFGRAVKASDKLGNLFDSGNYIGYSGAYGSFERILCNVQVEGISSNAVKAPLAFSKRRLLFGTGAGAGGTAAGNALYFFDAEGCALDSSLHTGAIEGPMVIMGGSGKLALALGEGGPEGKRGPRLSLLEGVGAQPRFVYEEDERDCISGIGKTPAGAVFDKGLSLISAGEADGTDGATAWRFAAPANSPAENASRLLAYVPNENYPPWRCMAGEMGGNGQASRFTLTPAQFLLDVEHGHHMATTHETGSNLAFWSFHGTQHWEQCSSWESIVPANPSGMAVGVLGPNPSTPVYEPLWFSGDGLRRDDSEMLVDARWRTSPAAVDENGRAYATVQTESGYKMYRFSSPCTVGGQGQCTGGERCTSPSGSTGSEGYCRMESDASVKEIPVGSPLLGNSPTFAGAEVYVVTTSGTVLALNAETLLPLWVQSLGIRVLPTTQPVLVPNTRGGGTLWVVGARGEVRGIRVSNEGLSQTASWPKAFRDNCNTSSSTVQATSNGMQNCF